MDKAYEEFVSMGWHASDMGKWISENFGPTLAANHKEVEMQIYEDQRSSESQNVTSYLDTMIEKYPQVKKYAKGINMHWYTDNVSSPFILDQVAQLYPDMYMLMTEACFGK